TVPSSEHLVRRAVLGASCRSTAADLPTAAATGEDRLVNKALIAALAAMSPPDRQVLALSALGGLSPAAIASILGVPVHHVGLVLRDGMAEVRSHLAV
ncbi:MAG TPA: sigma factor-like helix-turn-helix DNA-binding protein, partial [Acidimicrobiales bacterium]|nr:sigma factor-like helix-turn-helix DNA-binding protein [Acidimicrobiales bacterium]